MAEIVFQNSSIVLADSIAGVSAMSISEGNIVEVVFNENATALSTDTDFDGVLIFAGSIDIHNHGAVGVDVNEADANGLLRVAEFLARNGVTAWMPTLVPDSDENYRRAIAAIDELMSGQIDKPVAQAVGVHYEGVFASEKMCGALRPEFFKSYSGSEIDELPKLKKGVHMTTLAPEVDGGIELIAELVKEGWIVSIGHTKADAETLDRAFGAGARHMTHFFNAMTGVHHRELGVAGWGLANNEVTFDIIADGIHVHPKMLGFACRAKTPDKVSLISDSVAPTGLGDGSYELWGEKISVTEGRTRNERGSIAGSVITMQNALKHMLVRGFSLTEVSKMASSNPAALIGLSGKMGSIEVGKRADIIALDEFGKVRFTMIDGQLVRN